MVVFPSKSESQPINKYNSPLLLVLSSIGLFPLDLVMGVYTVVVSETPNVPATCITSLESPL